MNYCPSGTDLRGFIKTYVSEGGEEKGYFSYEWLPALEN